MEDWLVWFGQDPLRSENSLIVLKICCRHGMDFPVGSYVWPRTTLRVRAHACCMPELILIQGAGHTLKYTWDCARYSSWLFRDAMNSTEGAPLLDCLQNRAWEMRVGQLSFWPVCDGRSGTALVTLSSLGRCCLRIPAAPLILPVAAWGALLE
jgi:hypothetical protein